MTKHYFVKIALGDVQFVGIILGVMMLHRLRFHKPNKLVGKLTVC